MTPATVLIRCGANKRLNILYLPVVNHALFFSKVAKLMLAVRDRKCREHYGEDHWSTAEPKTKVCFDFLCGNHTRNLPVVRFNKVLFLSPQC